MHNAQQHRSGHRGVDAVSLVSDRTFPRHAHGHYGIGLISAGAHRSWSGTGQVEAGAGSLIAVNPGEIHDGAPIGGEARAWKMLYFDPAVLCGLLDEENSNHLEFAAPTVVDFLVAERFCRLFRGLTTTSEDNLRLDQQLVDFAVTIFDRHGSKRLAANRDSVRVGGVYRARKRLDDNPTRAVSLQELAKLAGMTRFTFLRAFSKEIGTTPYAYVLQRRVQVAQKLLRGGESPAAAASEAGFCDQSHLNRVFVRQLGVTPAKYRFAIA